MTDTPIPHEPPSPAAPAHPAENAEVTRVTGAAKTAEAVRPPAEDDDLVIEDLSDAAWPIPAPGICICTVGAE
ncbi:MULTISPECIES: hypothetical protein [Streptomyces violaceusniger group]|jgi:hypothetical protein|uniref:Uncharacterized protein n=2 Tax=Streptomyces javensis TaxID=114698 RepID=A0ABS0RSY5_9ACTN|nr:hypothetical protein [Streptomyces javensis]MBI0319959.1 hypothetical protein [Streptomyces javensis]